MTLPWGGRWSSADPRLGVSLMLGDSDRLLLNDAGDQPVGTGSVGL